MLQREAVERDERIKQWEQFKVVTRSKTRPKVSNDAAFSQHSLLHTTS